MAEQVPARVVRAVEALDVAPTAEVLEIGCGPGHAVAMLCERLTTGHVTAVDRSAVAVQRTLKRNAEAVASDVCIVLQLDFADLDLTTRFDCIFAINVNVFWVSPDGPDLDVVRSHLKPAGVLRLFYEVPIGSSPDRVVEPIAASLERHGFDAEVSSNDGLVCIAGRPRGGGSA